MKRLTITYDGMVLHDADVDTLAFTDSECEVAITGRRLRKPAAANTSAAVAGIGDLLARASKARTAASADKLKEAAADD